MFASELCKVMRGGWRTLLELMAGVAPTFAMNLLIRARNFYCYIKANKNSTYPSEKIRKCLI